MSRHEAVRALVSPKERRLDGQTDERRGCGSNVFFVGERADEQIIVVLYSWPASRLHVERRRNTLRFAEAV